MEIPAQRCSALPVPYAMESPDRVPKERYFDPDFYAMEVERLWPRARYRLPAGQRRSPTTTMYVVSVADCDRGHE